MKRILIIQTAFIGDVVLATAMVEQLARFYPAAAIDFLVRKGNEGVLDNNPHLSKVLVWDKNNAKLRNLLLLLRQVRAERYDLVVNVQRFFSTGFLTVFSKAATTVGFDKNPFSAFFSLKIKHEQARGIHEVARNSALVSKWTDGRPMLPKLYPSRQDFESVFTKSQYVTLSPASVWFTKQWPAEKWAQLATAIPNDTVVYMLGAKSDQALCEKIRSSSGHPLVEVMAGRLSFLQSAALMRGAVMNYVNDSAPLHFASAVGAPVTVVYCSTVPAFGFGPLSPVSHIVETEVPLSCRPCGLHGKKKCPEGHFKCSEIAVSKLLEKLN